MAAMIAHLTEGLSRRAFPDHPQLWRIWSREAAPTPQLLDGAAEAKLIAMRLGKPPAGFGHWTLRLLADQMVELEIVESISPETVRQTLKKTA